MFFCEIVLQLIGRVWTRGLVHAVPLVRECEHVEALHFMTLKVMKYKTAMPYRGLYVGLSGRL